jgi:hypothetical protein
MPTKNLQWFQRKAVSQISFMTAIVGILTSIFAVMWAVRVTNQNAEDIKEIRVDQKEQLILITKLTTIAEFK